MYRTRYVIDVLSEEPISPHLDIAGVIEECDTGEFVLADLKNDTTSLSNPEMADALTRAGSDPGFFNLDDNGNELEVY